MSTTEYLSGSATVTVDLPVQYRALLSAGRTTLFDLRIDGLVALYDSMPARVKEQISTAIATRLANDAANRG